MTTAPTPLPYLSVLDATVDIARQKGPTMFTTAEALLVISLIVGGLVAAAPASADPPCAQFNVCQYQPDPYNNGPLMPTWEVPGGYGLPGSPTVCDPQAYRCYPAVPGSGF